MKRLLIVLSLLAIGVSMGIDTAARADVPNAAGAQPQQGAANIRESLEVAKLREEIRKLEADGRVAYIAPFASLASILMLAVALIVQRQTSIKIQERLERTNFELKIADLVMSSYSPAAEQNRLDILTTLYRDRVRADFAQAFDMDKFLGLRKHEMLTELFKQLAVKCKNEDEVIEAFRRVFPGERARWFDKQFPVKTASTLTPLSSGLPPVAETRL